MSGGRCKRNCKHSHKKKRTRRKRTTRKLWVFGVHTTGD
jgi:hypothetical protein